MYAIWLLSNCFNGVIDVFQPLGEHVQIFCAWSVKGKFVSFLYIQESVNIQIFVCFVSHSVAFIYTIDAKVEDALQVEYVLWTDLG